MEGKLGAGTFGLVFLARCRADGETRAIKCIAKEAQVRRDELGWTLMSGDGHLMSSDGL